MTANRLLDEFSADDFTGPADPHWRAVQLLADYWGPALAAAQRLGFDLGYREGLVAGRCEESDAWNKIIGTWRETIKRPMFAELQRRRGESGAE